MNAFWKLINDAVWQEDLNLIAQAQQEHDRLVLNKNAVGNKLNGEHMPMHDRAETYRDWERHKVWDVINVVH